MDRLLRNLDFDRLSFWLGFLGGILFWWLLGRFRPMFSHWIQSLRERFEAARESRTAGIEGQLCNATILKAQQLHVASPLFPLEEILITPGLICPPPGIVPGGALPVLDIAEQAVPYMPDCPELRIAFGAPTMTLAQALEGDAHIAILGSMGSGKTVALAHLAVLLARHSELPAHLKGMTPLLVYAGDLLPARSNPQPVLEILAACLSQDFLGLKAAKLVPYLTTILSQGRAVLLLDGLDELPQVARTRVLEILSHILQTFPLARCVTTANPENFSGLPELGFVLLGLASWTEKQRLELLNQWEQGWGKSISGPSTPSEPMESLILSTWLVNDQNPLLPLELALKAWSVYAGDNLGPTGSQAIEAYLRRMCSNEPLLRTFLEKLAQQIVQSNSMLFTLEQAQACIADLETTPLPFKQEGPASNITDTRQGIPATITHMLPRLLEIGLLAARRENHYGFRHPAILSYLTAGKTLSNLSEREEWSVNTQSASYQAARADGSVEVTHRLQAEQEPLYTPLFEAVRWLRWAPENASWCALVIRQASDLIQKDYHPLTLRARFVTALAVSGASGVNVLFRQLLESNFTNVRLLGVFGCGLTRDIKSIPELGRLMTDPTPRVRQAVCLALVAIGSQSALEMVADALLHGDENLRRWCAEALANHPEEGYPTLQEGSTLDDILVRKAVIYGLQRVREPWARATLEKMQVEDSQWVVKNAASQAMEELDSQDNRSPRKLPGLSDLPWLIAFAGERGTGIAPGKPAQDLLLSALKEGTEEQKLAALEYMTQKADTGAVLKIYELLYADQGELREAAYNALWHLAGAGTILPPPASFGLGYTLRQMS